MTQVFRSSVKAAFRPLALVESKGQDRGRRARGVKAAFRPLALVESKGQDRGRARVASKKVWRMDVADTLRASATHSKRSISGQF